MKRITFARLAVLMLAVAGLALSGCGGDDNGGLSAEDMARIDAAEASAMMAQAEAEEAHEAADAAASELAEAQQELADLQAQQAEMDDMDEEEDTSALDEAIAALQMQIAALTAKTADPMTAMEILGGEDSKLSGNDRAALATKIAGQLNDMYDHDEDKGMVNRPELTAGETAAAQNIDRDARTRDVSHASQLAKGMLFKHAFKTGTMVDLTSSGDIETLSLKSVLKLKGVELELMSFSLKETDKVMVESGNLDADSNNAFITTGAAAGDPPATRTTTRRADGSMSVVITDSVTGKESSSKHVTYVGGSKIYEFAPNITIGSDTDPQTDNFGGTAPTIDVVAVRFLSDGRAVTHTAASNAMDYTVGNNAAGTNIVLPRHHHPNDVLGYKNAGEDFDILQHTATGYGAWLEDSFFMAYVLNAEDDAIISDPDEMARKIAWGGREHDSEMAANLSGRGETATWKGLMVGHDMDADAATFGDMLKGNAMITARVGEATLADNQAARTPDIVDVSLTNIINSKGKASRVPMIEWTNLDLTGGSFAKGSEIMGQFYDNGNEVVGEFDKEDIMGVFGAMEYEAMDDMMAGN